MREAAIVATARTAVGRANRGSFNATEAPVLGGHVLRAAVERAGIDPERIDDLYFGTALQHGSQGSNLGRLCVFASELPITIPAITMDRKCGSGLSAVAIAARSIMAQAEWKASVWPFPRRPGLCAIYRRWRSSLTPTWL